jgi:hypothetical protein
MANTLENKTFLRTGVAALALALAGGGCVAANRDITVDFWGNNGTSPVQHVEEAPAPVEFTPMAAATAQDAASGKYGAFTSTGVTTPSPQIVQQAPRPTDAAQIDTATVAVLDYEVGQEERILKLGELDTSVQSSISEGNWGETFEGVYHVENLLSPDGLRRPDTYLPEGQQKLDHLENLTNTEFAERLGGVLATAEERRQEVRKNYNEALEGFTGTDGTHTLATDTITETYDKERKNVNDDADTKLQATLTTYGIERRLGKWQVQKGSDEAKKIVLTAFNQERAAIEARQNARIAEIDAEEKVDTDRLGAEQGRELAELETRFTTQFNTVTAEARNEVVRYAAEFEQASAYGTGQPRVTVNTEGGYNTLTVTGFNGFSTFVDMRDTASNGLAGTLETWDLNNYREGAHARNGGSPGLNEFGHLPNETLRTAIARAVRGNDVGAIRSFYVDGHLGDTGEGTQADAILTESVDRWVETNPEKEINFVFDYGFGGDTVRHVGGTASYSLSIDVEALWAGNAAGTTEDQGVQFNTLDFAQLISTGKMELPNKDAKAMGDYLRGPNGPIDRYVKLDGLDTERLEGARLTVR